MNEMIVDINEASYIEGANERDNMLELAKKTPHSERRKSLTYRMVLDENGKSLKKIHIVPIKDLSTKYLTKILKWSDYSFFTNSSILMHTINEESLLRKRS